jgi:Tol biopolymer transport system component
LQTRLAWTAGALLAAVGAVGGFPLPAQERPPLVQAAAGRLTANESAFLANLQQVENGLPRVGEGYFSPDGSEVVFQAFPIGYPFYQIYVQKIGEKTPRLISTGRGRTTCAFFTRDGKGLIFASSHTDPEIEFTEKKARDEAAAGGRRRYEWDFDPHMEIYSIRHDGTGLRRLTDAPGYDAEGSFSHDGSSIVFTSMRDGDPDLYIMDADGGNVRQLTDAPGYDGGPFFSPDDRWVIFRSDRQKKDMLQLYAISADGQVEVQLTDNLDHVNWCPYFHPSGRFLIWAGADYSQGPRSANFDLWTMDLSESGGKLVPGKVRRITDHRAADVLPVFSPKGDKLMWTSTRTADGSSQLWIADWIGDKPGSREDAR